MKHTVRFCIIFAAVAACTAVASASTIDSSSATVSYLGYNAATDTLSNGSPSATFDIGTGGGVWATPFSGSNYVSYNANTAPGGSVTAPGGTYTYTTSITGAVAGSSLSLDVYADDTTSVFLNGVSVVPSSVESGMGGAGAHCTVGTPNCETYTTYTITGLTAGTNTLTFGVDQLYGSATGLDFAGTYNGVAPEPGSLMLLGTGLLGAAAAARRRFSI